MREARLKWCLEHENRTHEQWKDVVWSDETSVLLNHRRGGYRVWRRAEERVLKSCIRERWKGACEFMFWGAFSYDRKGPGHCWKPETKKEKDDAGKDLEFLNKGLEEWELATGMRRIGLRNKPGVRPTWNWNASTGKLVRVGSGGIDWYRYWKVILEPKLFPFAQECIKNRPNTVVMQDGAPPHVHRYISEVYNKAEVTQLPWCGNSPDLNPIEQAWPWLKRRTTRHGAPKNRREAEEAWLAAWEEIPQEQIKKWIDRLQRHVKWVIKLEGGNEYVEGAGNDRRVIKWRRILTRI